MLGLGKVTFDIWNISTSSSGEARVAGRDWDPDRGGLGRHPVEEYSLPVPGEGDIVLAFLALTVFDRWSTGARWQQSPELAASW